MNLAIEIKNLNHNFGLKKIYNNISIEFEHGKIYGLLGKSGTGKSTLINLIGNQLVCRDGEIKIFGKTVKEDISVLENVCIVREKEFFLKDYKVKSIFNMNSIFYKNYDYNLQNRLCRLFELNENLHYKNLSRGQKTLLSNIIGICSNCPITIFDEPTLGLDAVNRSYFYEALIESYAENNRTIIIATHLIKEVEELLENVIIIRDGDVKVADSIENVREKSYYITGKKENLDSIFELSQQTPIKSFGNNLTYWYYGELSVNVKERMNDLGISYERISLNELFLSINRKDVSLYE